MTEILVKLTIMVVMFVSVLGIGLLGMGLFRLLPKRFRKWIEELDK